MHLQYTADQQMIAEQARAFFRRECTPEVVRACWERETDLPEALWQRMAELGWLGAPLPEAVEGQGLDATDWSRILEEMGRALLPGGYLAHLFAALAVRFAGSEAQQQHWLPAAARGRRRLALARCCEGGRFDEMGGRFYADQEADGYLLFGEKLAVPGAAAADYLVVEAVLGLPERPEAGVAYFVVDRNAQGVQARPLEPLETGLRQAAVRLTGVRAPPEHRLQGAPGPEARTALEPWLELALVFDALGGAQHVLETTVAHASQREAFGQPIGAFQAVKHKCADMLYAVENLRSIAQWAAWCLDNPSVAEAADPAIALAMARATAMESYELVVQHGTQVHGAVAVTAEHELPRYARRARTLAQGYGSLEYYQERILQAHGLPAPYTAQPWPRR